MLRQAKEHRSDAPHYSTLTDYNQITWLRHTLRGGTNWPRDLPLGATDRVGRIATERLLAHGLCVRALTSNATKAREILSQ
jgi:hypothetical protein